MSDIDLLKLAAKAAGIVPLCFDSNNNALKLGNNRPDFCKRSWNPLIDDGDALRLAVYLRITPNIDDNMTDCEDCTESHLGDPYAASRRAIVRAAAEIGKAMP